MKINLRIEHGLLKQAQFLDQASTNNKAQCSSDQPSHNFQLLFDFNNRRLAERLQYSKSFEFYRGNRQLILLFLREDIASISVLGFPVNLTLFQTYNVQKQIQYNQMGNNAEQICCDKSHGKPGCNSLGKANMEYPHNVRGHSAGSKCYAHRGDQTRETGLTLINREGHRSSDYQNYQVVINKAKYGRAQNYDLKRSDVSIESSYLENQNMVTNTDETQSVTPDHFMTDSYYGLKQSQNVEMTYKKTRANVSTLRTIDFYHIPKAGDSSMSSNPEFIDLRPGGSYNSGPNVFRHIESTYTEKKQTNGQSTVPRKAM